MNQVSFFCGLSYEVLDLSDSYNPSSVSSAGFPMVSLTFVSADSCG